MGNISREPISYFNRKSQEITGSQYWAYFNGGLNLRETGFNRKKKGSQDSFQQEIPHIQYLAHINRRNLR